MLPERIVTGESSSTADVLRDDVFPMDQGTLSTPGAAFVVSPTPLGSLVPRVQFDQLSPSVIDQLCAVWFG